MKLLIKILTMIFVVFGLNACAIDEKINNLSDSLTYKNNVIAEKETKEVSNKSNINQENIEKLEMIKWKCFPLFSDEHVLTLGYFVNFGKEMFSALGIKDNSNKSVNLSEEFGIIELKSTGKKFPAVYMLKGVKHAFSFGGEELTNFMIEIDNSNKGYYYNFQNAKPKEKIYPEESYMCKRTKELVDVSNFKVWIDYFDSLK